MGKAGPFLDLSGAQSRLGLDFRDSGLLQEALTHSSFVNEACAGSAPDSQRLEYLGDAILDVMVGEWLFDRFPDAREGELTSLRARVVQTESLADFARAVDLGSMLRLGHGEEASGGRDRPANLCAAFEALVGAIYRDQGFDVARSWVHTFLERHAPEIDAQRSAKDPKSRLQELVQAQARTTPTYRIVAEQGPDHAKTFSAQAVIGGAVVGHGTGRTKQAAEQAAAAAALQDLRSDGPVT